jgi:hypothetical protein
VAKDPLPRNDVGVPKCRCRGEHDTPRS